MKQFTFLCRLLAVTVLASFGFGSVGIFRVSAENSGFENLARTDERTVSNQENGARLGKFDITFEKNLGQTDEAARFVVRGAGFRMFLTDTAGVYRMGETDVVKMSLKEANKAEMTEETMLETVSNYYIGNDRSKWLENVPHYASVRYAGVYDGIDQIYYGRGNQLEYDFIIEPDAKPEQIKLEFEGAKSIKIAENGDLLIETESGVLTQKKPYSYQETDGQRREIESRFKVEANVVSFELGEYDTAKQLVIDPKVDFATYYGGEERENPQSIDTDSQGNIYLAGYTFSISLTGSGIRNPNFETSVFVAKLAPNGQTVSYFTFLDGEKGDGDDGGFGGFEKNVAVAVDLNANAYITGNTESFQFPTTEGAYDRSHAPCLSTPLDCFLTPKRDGFATKLNSTGGLSYSTYFGGTSNESGQAIAVDNQGRAYIAGYTNSGVGFPKKNEFQGTGILGFETDAYFLVFNADGSDLVYSTGIAGSGQDQALGIDIDSSGVAYVTGVTVSNNFRTKNPFQANRSGGFDGFLTKIDPDLVGESSLIFSTYLGGSGDDVTKGVVVSNADVQVTGFTKSTNFPTQNALDSSLGGLQDAFVTTYSFAGAMTNSTYIGGSGIDEAFDIDTDKKGNSFIVGQTDSVNFPLALPFKSAPDGTDAFYMKLRLSASPAEARGIQSSTLFGGSGFDRGASIVLLNGKTAYIVGDTSSNNLPTTPNVIQSTFAGNQDAFVVRIQETHKDSVGFSNLLSVNKTITQTTPATVAQTVNFGVTGTALGADWNGDGIDTVGVFNGGGLWSFRNINFVTGVNNPITFNFGQSGDIAITGDWNGDGIDTAGVFRIVGGQGQFLLTNQFTPGNHGGTPPTFQVQQTITFGITGDKPVAGDWDGDGVDSVGVFRGSEATFFLTNSTDNAQNPQIDQVNFFGVNGDIAIAGDWNGDGVDTISVWRPSTREFFLTNDGSIIAQQFVFGGSGNDRPFVGDWDGLPNP